MESADLTTRASEVVWKLFCQTMVELGVMMTVVRLMLMAKLGLWSRVIGLLL